MDHLQTDIDSLETEKGQLKEKLKTYGKKTTPTLSGTEGITGVSLDVSLPGDVSQDNQLLLNQINALKGALNNEQQEKCKLLAADMFKKLESLSTLHVIDKRTVDSKLIELRKKRSELIKVLRLIN